MLLYKGHIERGEFTVRSANVPIDMSSEQKNLMGVVSTRQFIYLILGGSTIYAYVPPLAKLVFAIAGIIPAIIVSIIAALPVLAIVIFLGFAPVAKYNMNRDYYLLIKFQRKSNLGIWRKGRAEEFKEIE